MTVLFCSIWICLWDPWVGKIPWRRAQQPTLVFLPRKWHGQRTLVGSIHRIAKSWTWLKQLSTQRAFYLNILPVEREWQGETRWNYLTKNVACLFVFVLFCFVFCLEWERIKTHLVEGYCICIFKFVFCLILTYSSLQDVL